MEQVKEQELEEIRDSKKKEKENKMGSAPVLKLILSMSLPAMFSMLIQSLYNIVDSIFVAKIGQDALTAVTLASPIQMLLIAVAVGTAIGINSVVSRRLGEKKVKEASKAATHGLFLAIISGVVFAILGIFFTRPFFEAFTNDQAVIQMGCDYIYVITIFSFGLFLQINIEKTLQATGNMIYPMLFQLSGAITNIILDPIFIFGWLGLPAMGVRGAAIATVSGQIVAMIFSMIIIHVKSHDVHMSIRGFKFEWSTIKDIYSVGIPSIVMQAISFIIITAMNAILISFSNTAVNVFGAYSRIQSFIFMPVFGLTHGLMPIMGYNFGARKRERLVSALKIGCIIALIIMAIGVVIFMTIPDKLLMLFEADAEMLSIGTVAFRLLSLSFPPAAIGIIMSTLFQGIGIGTKSLIISVLRQLVFLIPAAYLLKGIGLNYVWLSFPIAEAGALIIAIILMVGVFKKNINTLMPIESEHHKGARHGIVK